MPPPASLPEPPEPEPQIGPETARLFQAHAAEVWRFLKYLGVPKDDLPDACQEVFLIAHRKLPEFRGEATSRTWLYGISLRVAKTWRRRKLLVPLADEERSVGPLQEQEQERRDTHELLCWALDRISEAQREVFVLHEIEELPMIEVAERVDCGLFTAYSRLRLARRALKRALAEKGVKR
ncbi:MAG: polymerase sigma factor RpoE [Polyangiaceae bacterium]|nr:polymerase sigma factor RpoE [Polyangiaceae bacterium]